MKAAVGRPTVATAAKSIAIQLAASPTGANQMALIKEFREFALKGNVIDLAVGVIIGAAFGKIVTSVIEDMIMPVVGLAGNVDFTNLYFGLTEKVRAAVALGIKDGKPLGLADARKVGPVL